MKKMDDLINNAQEAEADPDRHLMEEAILATLAKGGPDDPFNQTFFQAYYQGTLTFSRSDLKAIADVIHEAVCIKGVAADEILLRDRLGSASEIKALKEILDGSKAVDPTIARAYIEKINAQDKRRAALDFGQKYIKAIEAGEDVETAVADLLGKGYDLSTRKKLLRDYPNETEAAEGFLDILDARRTDGREWLGLDSGFKHLNEVLNGLPEGVIMLAGAPSCGKTTMAKQIADHIAKEEKIPVLFYSFEQSAEELRIKSLARLAEVDSRRIWKGRSEDEDWKKVESNIEAYRQGPGPYLKIIEAGRKDTVEAIRAAALMEKRKAQSERILLVLDYLQIIPAGKESPDVLREKIDWNLTELRRLSRDIKSPIIVVSSMNRAAYDANKPPTMAAMKESGGIEYSADVVICLWRNKEESEHFKKMDLKPTTDRVEAYVLKNRNGELAKIKLNFIKSWATFSDEEKESLDYDSALGN
jgi:replicative DNA helicase